MSFLSDPDSDPDFDCPNNDVSFALADFDRIQEGIVGLLHKLRDAVHQAQKENDLPDYLAERILQMVEQPQKYAGKKTEINDLIAQLALYDTYGQTGYLGMGVNNAILEKTLKRLENRAQG